MEKILVIKLRHHGDVLLTTALYRALSEQFHGVRVDTVVYKETTPLLENNPHLNKIWCIDRKTKGFARVKAELGLIWSLRRESYDAVIHLTDQWIGALIARASRAPMRVQMFYAKRDRALWHNSFTHRINPPPRGQAHAIELNLMCLNALGLKPEALIGKMALNPSPKAADAAEAILNAAGIRGPFVLIHPAARWPFKCWTDSKFAEVVVHLLNNGLHVVLTCSPDEVEKAMTGEIERLARQKYMEANSGRTSLLINRAGQVTLPVVAALLQRCAFYVGVDSAPMHMAAALDVPQVALFGPSWLNEWRPWSDKAQVIYAGDYGPLPHPDSINTDDPTRLLDAIPTEVVIEAVDRLIDSSKAMQS